MSCKGTLYPNIQNANALSSSRLSRFELLTIEFAISVISCLTCKFKATFLLVASRERLHWLKRKVSNYLSLSIKDPNFHLVQMVS